MQISLQQVGALEVKIDSVSSVPQSRIAFAMCDIITLKAKQPAILASFQQPSE